MVAYLLTPIVNRISQHARIPRGLVTLLTMESLSTPGWIQAVWARVEDRMRKDSLEGAER